MARLFRPELLQDTVLVDGKGQVRDTKNRELTIAKEPVQARWQTNSSYDFAAGIYNDGYGNLTDHRATHTRRVLFVKPDLFVVADTLTPNDAKEHTYQARWNLLSTATALDEQTHAVTTVDKGKPNLAIVPLPTEGLEVRSVSAQTEPEMLGWYVRKDADPAHIPATTVLHTRKGPGVQNFLTLLLPVRPGEASPIKTVQPGARGATLVTMENEKTLAIRADPQAEGGIEVTETLANGQPGRHIEVKAATAP